MVEFIVLSVTFILGFLTGFSSGVKVEEDKVKEPEQFLSNYTNDVCIERGCNRKVWASGRCNSCWDRHHGLD